MTNVLQAMRRMMISSFARNATIPVRNAWSMAQHAPNVGMRRRFSGSLLITQAAPAWTATLTTGSKTNSAWSVTIHARLAKQVRITV